MKKLAFLALGIALAGAAHAMMIPITVASFGTWALGAPGTYLTVENVVVDFTAPLPPVSTLNYQSGAYLNSVGTSLLANGPDWFKVTTTIDGFTNNGLVSSVHGSWTYLAGGGGYAGVVGGAGTFSQSLQSFANLSQTTFVGDLYTPVPEPASLAALGIGVMALLRRRSRAA